MPHKSFQESIIEYFKKYYKKHKKAPSTRQIFKDVSKAKFYQTFPNGLAEACKLAEIPVPEASIKRMKKALQASEKKRVREIKKEATPVQDLKQSYQIQQREEQRRKEFAEKHAKEDALLLQDPNEAIRRPVVNAIENYALPVLLETKYGIKATVPEILAMLKLYQKAKDEGWCVEDVMEWSLLSQEAQKAFLESWSIARSEKGGNLTRYFQILKDEIKSSIEQKNRILREIAELKKKRSSVEYDYRVSEYYYSSLKTRYDNLKKDYEKRENQLANKYYQMHREYMVAYEKAKREMNLKIGKQVKEYQRLEMRNKKLRTLYNPVKRLSSKRSHSEIDFTKLRNSLGFPVSVSKKEKV